MTHTAPIALPHQRWSVSPVYQPEEPASPLVPRASIDLPHWAIALVAVARCAFLGHVAGRVTMQGDGHHHCLCCGRVIAGHARRR